ncbi:MAG: YkgJ family cysteine cluster protein [archaeon]
MKFECKCCGFCCKNFGEGNNKYLPIFEWEVNTYSKIAKQRNIKMDFKPVHYLLDEKSGVVFCYLYGMTSEPCPFLKDNKCSIYKDRAIICQQFPLLWTAKLHIGDNFGASCFSECPNFDCKKDFDKKFTGKKEVKKGEIDEYLKETYGDCFDSAVVSNILGRLILEIIKKHDLAGDLKLKQIEEKDLDKYKPMSFTEFLRFKGFEEDAKELEKMYEENK